MLLNIFFNHAIVLDYNEIRNLIKNLENITFIQQQ